MSLEKSTITVTADMIEYNGICYQHNSSTTLKIVANLEHPYSGDFFIPASAMFKDAEMSVTGIGEDAFAGCDELTRIVIPNTIKKIGETAFKGCSNLVYVKVSDGSSLKTNLDVLFSDSPIKELYVGSDGISYNSDSRLLDNVTGMTLGNSVTTFPPAAAFNSLEYFVVEDGDMPIKEKEDYCKKNTGLINKQTVKDPYSLIYFRLFYLVTYTHLSPILEAMENSTLNYVHIGRRVQGIEVDASLTQEMIPTTAGSRYQEYGYKDEVNYQYQELIAKSNYNRNPIEGISFDESVVELNIGESIRPNVIFTPTSASYVMLDWTSSDENVAVVDIFGNITKLSDGEAVITATTTDGTGLSAICRITNPGTGIDDIASSSATGVYSVFDLLGNLVARTDSVGDIRLLPSGIYIVNGEKIIIK